MSPTARKAALKGNPRLQSPKKSGTHASAARSDYPTSTNVSSPIQAKSRRRAQQQNEGVRTQRGYSIDDDFVVPDDEEVSPAESDDGFEPLREVGKSRPVSKKHPGPPITVDEKMEGLNSIHRAVVEDFLIQAKEESKKVSL